MSPRIFQRKSLRGQSSIKLNDFPRYYLKAVLIVNKYVARGLIALHILGHKTYEGFTVISHIVITNLFVK